MLTTSDFRVLDAQRRPMGIGDTFAFVMNGNLNIFRIKDFRQDIVQGCFSVGYDNIVVSEPLVINDGNEYDDVVDLPLTAFRTRSVKVDYDKEPVLPAGTGDYDESTFVSPEDSLIDPITGKTK